MVKNYLLFVVMVLGCVYASWAETVPAGGSTIKFTGSQDGGLTWGPVISLDDAPGRGTGPVGIAVDPAGSADDVYVVWQGNKVSGSSEIYFDHVIVAPT